MTNTEIQSVVSTRQNATNIQLNQIANQTSESLAKVSKDYANSIATSNKFGYIAGGEFHFYLSTSRLENLTLNIFYLFKDLLASFLLCQ